MFSRVFFINVKSGQVITSVLNIVIFIIVYNLFIVKLTVNSIYI